jgi:hypothetical protein
MKLRTILFALMIAGVFVGRAFPAGAVTSANLLANGGAEAGDFTGWTQDVTGEPWTVSGADAQEGANSFLSGNRTSTLFQMVDLLALGYTEAQLDSITGILLSGWVKEYDDAGEDDAYDFGLQMLGAGFGAMAITSLSDPHVAPSDWTERLLGLGSYGAGMRHILVILQTSDGARTAGNHGAMFDNFVLTMSDDSDPTLSSVSPADGTRGVARGVELSLEFSENVFVGSGDLVVWRESDGTAAATIDVASTALPSYFGGRMMFAYAEWRTLAWEVRGMGRQAEIEHREGDVASEGSGQRRSDMV